MNGNIAPFGGTIIASERAKFISVSNSYFHNNTATESPDRITMTDSGIGNLKIYYTDKCEFKNNIFENNYANIGGGIRLEMINETWIYNNTFIHNFARTSGGAIGILPKDKDKIHIENCHFQNNTSHEYAGALYSIGGSNLLLTNSLFVHNTAKKHGGGVVLENISEYTEILKVKFIENSSKKYGGFFLYNCNSTRISDSKFIKNDAKVEGGGLILKYLKNVTLDNLEISFNTAHEGSGSVLYMVE